MARSARITGNRVLSTGRFDLTKTDIEVVEDDGVARTLSHEIYRHGRRRRCCSTIPRARW
jgi:hypothetical protein